MTVQAQNVELLRSMERNGARQLRLQHLVEGLSVVAVSYYALGLFSYVIRAVTPALDRSLEYAEALAVPPIIALVWLYLRHQVRRIERDDERR